jgi:hypothetical protein
MKKKSLLLILQFFGFGAPAGTGSRAPTASVPSHSAAL